MSPLLSSADCLFYFRIYELVLLENIKVNFCHLLQNAVGLTEGDADHACIQMWTGVLNIYLRRKTLRWEHIERHRVNKTKK